MLPSLHNLVGAGPRSRKREEYESLSNDHLANLNQIGGFVIPLSQLIPFESMIHRLDEGTSRWFYAMVNLARQEPLDKPGKSFNADRLRAEKRMYDRLTHEQQQFLLSFFDPMHAEGRFALTDSKQRTLVADRLATGYGCNHYLSYLIMRSKMGNAAMGLAHIEQAWTETGFGLWAHVVPNEGLSVCMNVANLLSQTMGLHSQMHSHFPHVIYKPYNSSVLNTHHDQMDFQTLIDNLNAHVQSQDDSTLAWVKKHGLQMLAHILGGRNTDAEQSGATYILGPMTPRRLLLVLTELYNNSTEYGINPSVWSKENTIYFLPYEKYLPDLNAMLKRIEGPEAAVLRRIPLQTNDSSLNSTIIGWPVGWLHGSFASDNARRVTLTVPLDVRENVAHDVNKQTDALQWLEDLATISSTSFDTEAERLELQAANHRIVTRRDKFAHGSTHRNPFIAGKLMRSREAAAILHEAVGWFYNIGPHRDTVKEMRRMFLPSNLISNLSNPSNSSNSSNPPTLENQASQSKWPLLIVPSLVVQNNLPPHTVVPAIPLHAVQNSQYSAASSSNMAPSFLNPRDRQIIHELSTIDDLRCLNVRQPWASLLVEGIKRVENRPLSANRPHFDKYMRVGEDVKGEWVLIVASTARPTQSVMVQAQQDFQKCYGPQGRYLFDEFVQRHSSQWPLGSIVGAVRFDALITPEVIQMQAMQYSTNGNSCVMGWYHGAPDVGWHVRANDAIAFSSPIPNIPGVLSIARISSKGAEVEAYIRSYLRQM